MAFAYRSTYLFFILRKQTLVIDSDTTPAKDTHLNQDNKPAVLQDRCTKTKIVQLPNGYYSSGPLDRQLVITKVIT